MGVPKNELLLEVKQSHGDPVVVMTKRKNPTLDWTHFAVAAVNSQADGEMYYRPPACGRMWQQQPFRRVFFGYLKSAETRNAENYCVFA